MSETKQEFILSKIGELIDSVVARESIPSNSDSYDELQWIKFYAKDLASKCKGCEEAPQGVKTKKQE